MRIEQLRQADLNLLTVFVVLAEKRSVSAAAERLSLSQPAVSRSLRRLQALFGDQLLVRAKKGYELTRRGESILVELETLMPRLDRLLRGKEFDPNAEPATFKITGTDYTFSVLGAGLSQRLLGRDSKLSIEFTPWSEAAYQDLETGRSDLAITTDHGVASAQLKSEALYDESFVCLVARRNPLASKMTLKAYGQAEHVVVSLLSQEQPILDRPLARLGIKRKARLRVPYFSAAVEAIAGTALVATVPARFARSHLSGFSGKHELRVLAAPKEVARFRILMAWHPRLETDAANAWLRGQIRALAKELRA